MRHFTNESVFELDENVPLDCLLEKETWKTCDTETCKLYIARKAKAWHRQQANIEKVAKEPEVLYQYRIIK